MRTRRLRPNRNRAARALLAAATALFAATSAQAHPKMLSSDPARGAAVTAPARIVLKFSETLEPRFSGADLSSTSMMMDGKMVTHDMKLGELAAALDPKDAKTLILTPKAPLAAGGYRVKWHAVSTDTHRVQGILVFTVR